MNDDLARYLESIDARLPRYLDEGKDLALGTAEHLYRYAVALLQGLVKPAHVQDDWADFFFLADAFVLAYGSRRLGMLSRGSFLLASGKQEGSLPLTGTDRTFLVAFVRELGQFVSARQHTSGGGTR
jgi:hypothetical protein